MKDEQNDTELQPVADPADHAAATPEQPADPAPEPAHDLCPDVDVTGNDIPDPGREFSDAAENSDRDVEPTCGEVADLAHETSAVNKSGDAEGRQRLLLGPSPTIAGEKPAEFERIMAALRTDYPRESGGRVLRQWLIETAALKMLTARRGTRAERGAWQAALADSLLRRLVDHAALQELRRDDSCVLTQKDEAIEQGMSQRFWRAHQQISRAAVAGDSVALQRVEKDLGTGALEIDRAVDFGALYEVLASIDRVVRPANADAAAAFRQLEKRKKRAEKKRRGDQAAAPARGGPAIDLGTSELATRPEQALTATNTPTVIAPKAAGEDKGGGR
jgi:hypothetical protein